MSNEKYHTFRKLAENEIEEIDYRIRRRLGKSGIAVMAPHGGCIEPGTTEIAEAVAGNLHSFYSFSGLKAQGCASLHITSRQFDESSGIQLAGLSDTILTIHGCKDSEEIVFIGGTDNRLKEKVKRALEKSNFQVQETTRFPGTNLLNICNRSRSGIGVQLEISAGLRHRMFYGLTRIHRKKRTALFDKFVAAVQKALGA